GASAEPGGKARLEARLPGRGDQLRAIDYLTGLIREHRVDYQGGRLVDAEAVLALEPDAVVLATGSTLRAPALEPGSEPMTGLREAAAELVSKVGSRSGTAVLFDQDHTAPVYAAAELLAERFDKAVLITPRVQIARSVPYVSGIGVYRRLYRAGVEIVLAAAPVSRQGGRFTYRNVFTGETGTIDGVTLACYATPRIADGALAEPLRQAGIEVHLVGDCYAPRSPLAAVHEGHRVGSGL
ncbi:MAG: oxidoreductase, partial [bacterium]